MNHKLLAMVIVSTLVVFAVPNAFGFGLNDITGVVTGFEKTMTVEKVEVQPSLATDSYFLVYGFDNKGQFTIVELQLNWISVGGNFDDGLGGELNRDMLKYVVEQNIGNTITFECNGANEWLAFMEEYPQCFKITDIQKNPNGGSLDERVKYLEGELAKATSLAQEQMKVIKSLTS